MKRFPLLALLCALAGCDPYGPTFCTDVAIPAIRMIINDSTTNSSVTSGDLMVVAKTTTYSDTLRTTIGTNNFPWTLAYERPGNYTVEVSVTGYRPWSASNILVQEDECHVITRTVTARMQSAP